MNVFVKNVFWIVVVISFVSFDGVFVLFVGEYIFVVNFVEFVFYFVNISKKVYELEFMFIFLKGFWQQRFQVFKFVVVEFFVCFFFDLLVDIFFVLRVKIKVIQFLSNEVLVVYFQQFVNEF